jgi:NADPH:quinone reductase-like Zn-dependent oxidoreductase
MKAFTFEQYGSADVLKLVDLPKPKPKANDVLVRVYATSVNPADWHLMRADPFLVRLAYGLFKPKNSFLGADVAGVVVEVGSEVKNFKPGDEVFGDVGSGAFAEYVMSHEKHLVHKPKNITFEQAAAVPLAGITALQALRFSRPVERGQSVLVNGASGGVGTFTVQIAKAFGAEVTAVCSTRNFDMVKSLGADVVIDYTQQDFTQMGKQYDFVVDNVANHSVFKIRRVLKPNGVGAIIGFSGIGHLLVTSLFGSRGGKKVASVLANINSEDLYFLKGLLESGKLVPAIDKSYPFTQLPDAIRYLETLRAKGKVVITVEGGK